MKDKQDKVGRPSVGEKKLPIRSLTSDPEVEIFLKEHPGINASEVFRRSIRALMPKDSHVIRLEKLAKDISEMRSDLAVKEAEYQSLKKEIDDREKIKIDLRLEEDCDAWYLKNLMERGVIREVLPDPITPESFMPMLTGQNSHVKEDTVFKDGRWRIVDNPHPDSLKAISRTGLRVDHGIIIEAKSRPPYLVPNEQELASRYGLWVDQASLLSVFGEAEQASDISLEILKKFRPRILDDKIRTGVKRKMEPLYMNPPQVKLSDRGEISL